VIGGGVGEPFAGVSREVPKMRNQSAQGSGGEFLSVHALLAPPLRRGPLWRRTTLDCEALAGRLRWRVAKVYVDNDLSAWTGKRRPDYEQMLSDIRAGKVDAVIVWHEDRLTRLPRELEEFADTCLKAGVAQGGRPNGGRRPYGYEGAVHDAHGAILNRDRAYKAIVPTEAERIREAAERVLAGESVRSVAKDWNEQEVPTPNGGELWNQGNLKRGCRTPRDWRAPRPCAPRPTA
jgi:hypothetical protein